MSRGRHGGWRSIAGAARRWSLFGALVLGSGCSPLQKTWTDRFGPDRLVPIPTPHDLHHGTTPPTPVPEPVDSYASRVDPAGDAPASGWSASSPDRRGDATPPTIPMPSEAPPVASPTAPTLVSAPADRAPDPVEPHSEAIGLPPVASAPTLGEDEPVDELDAIDRAMDRGIEFLSGVRNYRATVDRQERVRGSLLPAEQVMQSVRTEPFAVRLEWPDGPNKGREVLYSEAECNGMMHVKLPRTLIPVPPMQLDPQSPLALSNSRHPITEAGLLHILDQTKEQVAKARSGDPSIGEFSIVGPHVPDDFEGTCVEVLRTTPEGEFWRLVVDHETSLPILLQADAPNGDLLERYHFQDIRTDLDELDESDAFDPAARFGRPITLPVDRLSTARPD